MNISTNSIIMILVGIIVIMGGYLFFNKSSNTNSVSSSTPEATTTTVTTTTNPPPKNPTQSTSAPKTISPAPKVASPTMTKDGLYVIYYTNGGFSPKTLQLSKGRGVRFINNSDKAMRIFADQKNDNIYGALNQSKTVGRGATYDFVFNEAGNWAYHNENNQSDRGTVVVTEK